MIENIELLESVAAAATQGPWELVAFDSGHSQYETESSVVTASHGDEILSMNPLNRLRNEVDAKSDGFDDANFIATFDPPTVTTMLKEVRGSRFMRAVFRTQVEQLLGDRPGLSDDDRTGADPQAAVLCLNRADLEKLFELAGMNA